MSVFLNTGAQSALRALSRTSNQLLLSQGRIATGKTVNTAADNPSVWAVGTLLQADVSGYTAIGQSLSLGKATVAVARSAAEKVTSLLTEVKELVVTAQSENVDVTSIQSSIDDLTDQIDTVVGSAQFNGANLLQNLDSGSSSAFNVLASYERTADGSSISARDIVVDRQDLQTDAYTLGATAATATDYFATATDTAAASGSLTIDIESATVAYGASYQVSLVGAGSHAFGTSAENFEYVAREGDTQSDVAQALYDQISDHITANELSADMSVSIDYATNQVTVTNSDADAGDTLSVTNTATTDGVAGGGLSDLAQLDVTTDAGRADALAKIDTLIDTATNAAAALGSSESRIEIQSEFMSDVAASIEAGAAALMGANLERESARMQSLQIQQQLATQALSIANAAPKRLLMLFQGV